MKHFLAVLALVAAVGSARAAEPIVTAKQHMAVQVANLTLQIADLVEQVGRQKQTIEEQAQQIADLQAQLKQKEKSDPETAKP